LLNFEVDTIKKEINNLLLARSDSLRTLNLSRNKITTEYLEQLAEFLEANPTIVLDKIEMWHLKEAYLIDWNEFFGSFLRLKRPFTFVISGYQTEINKKQLQAFQKIEGNQVSGVLV